MGYQERRVAATPIDAVLAELHAAYGPVMDGHLADYIPELAKADPAHFGIAIATADGGLYSIGDCGQSFTIQSISKAFVYGLALEDHGRDHVLGKVGVEPSGDAFNSIVFDKRGNRPFNPMVNAGAIATSALIKGHGATARLERVLDMFQRYTGRPMMVDHSVFMSEKATGHRNRAIAHLELNFGMIDERVEEHLELYFQQCSILVNCRDLALMAATLANGGVNPQTGERALAADYVKNVVAVMNSCGMYDYSGEWGYRIGLPAKSGVGGGIIAVLPGRLGIGVFSPLLDPQGNSVRGIKVCEDLSQRFGLNMFDTRPGALSTVRRCCDGTLVGSKRSRNATEQAELTRNASRMAVLDLQGDLDFTAIEQVVRRTAELSAEVSHVILDFRRVGEIEPSAAGILATLAAQQQAQGRKLRLAHLWPGSDGHGRLSQAGVPAAAFAADCDSALEWAEQDILAECAPAPAAEALPLAAMDLLQGLDGAQLAELAKACECQDFAPGAAIFKEGDPPSHLYFLARGTVSVHVGLSGGRSRRLTTLGPGVAFGEMALLDGDNRSAEVRADTPVTVHALAVGALGETLPAIQAVILVNVGRMLSQRLRKANDEIRSWE